MVECAVVAAQRHKITSYDGCNVRAVGHFTGSWNALVRSKEAIRRSSDRSKSKEAIRRSSDRSSDHIDRGGGSR